MRWARIVIVVGLMSAGCGHAGDVVGAARDSGVDVETEQTTTTRHHRATTTTEPVTTTTEAPFTPQFPGHVRSDVILRLDPKEWQKVYNSPFYYFLGASDVRIRDTRMGTYLTAWVSEYNSMPSTQIPYNRFDWSLQTPTGAIVAPGICWDMNDELNSGQLAPTGQVNGHVCFEVERSPGWYYLFHQLTGGYGARAVFPMQFQF